MSKQNIILVVGVTIGIITGFMLGRITAPGPTPRFVHLERTPSDQMFDNKTGLKCSTFTPEDFLKARNKVREATLAAAKKDALAANDYSLSAVERWEDLPIFTRIDGDLGEPVYCSDLVKWYEK